MRVSGVLDVDDPSGFRAVIEAPETEERGVDGECHVKTVRNRQNLTRDQTLRLTVHGGDVGKRGEKGRLIRMVHNASASFGTSLRPV